MRASSRVVCGGGSNGGDGRVAARVLEEAGRDVLVVDAKPEDEDKELGDPDVLVDALFGTGFEGEPRPGAARLIEQINASARPCCASTSRRAWTRRPARWRARPSTRT